MKYVLALIRFLVLLVIGCLCSIPALASYCATVIISGYFAFTFLLTFPLSFALCKLILDRDVFSNLFND
jgi:hypothetical protein